MVIFDVFTDIKDVFWTFAMLFLKCLAAKDALCLALKHLIFSRYQVTTLHLTLSCRIPRIDYYVTNPLDFDYYVL